METCQDEDECLTPMWCRGKDKCQKQVESDTAKGPLDGATCSAWRDPKTDPPTKTGKILVWLHGVGPALVNVEERRMAYWNGHDETCPADPDEWDLWAEINTPNAETIHPE